MAVPEMENPRTTSEHAAAKYEDLARIERVAVELASLAGAEIRLIYRTLRSPA